MIVRHGITLHGPGISGSYIADIHGRRVVIKRNARGHYRYVAHPWPMMVTYPEVLAKATTIDKLVAMLLEELK